MQSGFQRITPCLWFDDQAEEAVGFYTSVFPNSRIGATTRYTKEAAEVSGRLEGSVGGRRRPRRTVHWSAVVAVPS